MAPFDPYYQWLGIPIQEQPASHYRLLGIPEFDGNVDIIKAAAEQRTIYLRTLQSGEHEVLVAQLLNEVSQARVTLLNADQKAEYDEQLRKQQTPELESEPAREQDPLAFAAEELASISSRPATRSRGGKPFWQQPWAIPAAAGGVMVLLLLMWLFGSGEEPKGSGQEQELQAEIALLKEKLVAAGNNKGEGNAELSQQNAELEAQIGDRSLDSSNVEGIPFELNSSESIKDPIFTYNLQGAYDGDIGMVLDPNKEIDLGKSWILRFTLTPPESPQKRRPFIVWGDSRPGLDALVISYGEGLLSFSVTDCNNRSGKGGRLPVDLKIGAEIDIELEYSSRSNTIAITADGDREEVQLDFTPALDRESPLYIGIIQGHPGRFVGTVANFQFGNIERPAKRNSGLPAFLKQGLVAYYPFNGNAQDESGNGRDGAPAGVVFNQDRHGDIKSAAQFNGVAHIALSDVGLPSASTPRSISLWVKGKPLPHRGVYFTYGKLAPSTALTLICFPEPEYRGRVVLSQFGNETRGEILLSQSVVTNDKWHHVTVTFTGATAEVFIDGRSEDRRPLTKRTILTGTAFIGNLHTDNSPGSKHGFTGSLDDIRIYNRALSAAEVKALYDYESKPPALPIPNAPVIDSITNTIGMTFNKIPAGTFMMGSLEGETDRRDREHQHTVTITKPFYMQTTEVTQGQWKALMGTEPWKGEQYVKEGPNYPATHASWEDAVVYCEKLSAKVGKTYRLPTEAEWEYACRAGTETAWSFGDDEKALGDYAWYRENAWGIDEKYAHQVKLKKSNAFGLHDMHGNVWEWCYDYYEKDYHQQSPTNDPQGPESGSSRVLRGGSWGNSSRYARSADRYGVHADNRFSVGFRLVRELD